MYPVNQERIWTGQKIYQLLNAVVFIWLQKTVEYGK